MSMDPDCGHYGSTERPIKNVERVCLNCRFFSASFSKLSAMEPKTGVGERRKKPPTEECAFPFVSEDDWCGEFSAA